MGQKKKKDLAARPFGASPGLGWGLLLRISPRGHARGYHRLARGASLANSEGFTLVELMVVVIIIGLLAALVLPQFTGQLGKAEIKAAQAQIVSFGTALDTFRLDVGRYPTTEEGLQALRQKPGALDRWDGPYVQKDIPLDPWGRPYVYKSPGDHGGPFDIVSYGADGAPGGEKENRDIVSW